MDLGRRAGAELGRRSGRLVFRERFRLFLHRQFTGWKIAELSAEPDLEHSLSPAFPRACLRHGQHAWAAIACPPDGDPAAVLSFGLIWLAYLRARERRATVEGLAIYIPAGRETATALRLLCLDPSSARFELFALHRRGLCDSRGSSRPRQSRYPLEPCRRPEPNHVEVWERVTALPGGGTGASPGNGRISLRVRGIEFGELTGGELMFGLGERRTARQHHLPEIERLVEELARARASRLGPRPSALPAVSGSVAGIAGARQSRDPGRFPAVHAPSMARFPRSPAESAACSTCWRWIAPGRLAVIELKASRGPPPAPAVAGLLDACEMAPGPRPSSPRTATFRAWRCAPGPRGSCWSRRVSIFIQLPRPY